jgi:hypothetical protein
MASRKKIIVYIFMLALSIQDCIASGASKSSGFNGTGIHPITPEEKAKMTDNIRKSFEQARRQYGIVSPAPQQ